MCGCSHLDSGRRGGKSWQRVDNGVKSLKCMTGKVNSLFVELCEWEDESASAFVSDVPLLVCLDLSVIPLFLLSPHLLAKLTMSTDGVSSGGTTVFAGSTFPVTWSGKQSAKRDVTTTRTFSSSAYPSIPDPTSNRKNGPFSRGSVCRGLVRRFTHF